MQGYIGYTRVSTVKQGMTGVSLPEQRDAISHYAARNQMPLDLWLEEMETAAKRGRPVFNEAVKLLRSGKYKGIILHKLDRGARNLKDWSDIGELADQGIEVHFVSEGLDLNSRGGRLSADIQAVVAADYIRNLREETRKGFYGRLKQGLYPLPAPIGYVDNGKGKPKTIDPIMGPLVRKAFELYASTKYNLATLTDEMHRLGLRNLRRTQFSRSALATALKNPFYIGIIRLQKTNETFAGIHEPLIPKSLFDRVHNVLVGKTNTRTQRHAFQFRRMLSCTACGYSLTGELQKGNIYYRCHTAKCLGASIREDVVEGQFARLVHMLHFSPEEKTYLKAKLLTLRRDWADQRENEIRNLKLQIDQNKDRLNRLTDAFLDRMIDKTIFEDRKNNLLFEQKTMEETLNNFGQNKCEPEKLEKFFELLGDAQLSYQTATVEEKREMAKILTSNRCVLGKKLELEPSFPFREIINRFESEDGGPQRDALRTLDRILNMLSALNRAGQLPDLSRVFSYRRDTDSLPEHWKN